jgi:hypothetical protein
MSRPRYPIGNKINKIQFIFKLIFNSFVLPSFLFIHLESILVELSIETFQVFFQNVFEFSMDLLLTLNILSGHLNLLIIYLSLLCLFLNSISSVQILFLRLNKLISFSISSSDLFLLFSLLNNFSILSIGNLLAKRLAIEIPFIFHPFKETFVLIKKGHLFEPLVDIFEKVSKKHFLDLIESFHYNFF